MRIEAKSGATPQTIVLLKAKAQEFLKRCEAYPEPLVTCLSAARSAADLSSCRFENKASVRPDPELMDLCASAYKNARMIISAAGAPGPALAKFDESQPEALIQCTREPRAVVECLSRAGSMVELRACRESVDGLVPEVPADIKNECEAIHATVFKAGEVPEFFEKKWKKDLPGFVVECSRMPQAMRSCMQSATKFADFQACAKAVSQTKGSPPK